MTTQKERAVFWWFTILGLAIFWTALLAILFWRPASAQESCRVVDLGSGIYRMDCTDGSSTRIVDTGNGYRSDRRRGGLQTYPQYFPPPAQGPEFSDNFMRGLEMGQRMRRK